MLHSKIWSKEIVLSDICSKKLNISIINNKDIDQDSNTLMIKTNDYKSMSELGSKNWCVAYSNKHFNCYTKKGTSLVICFNFDLPPNDPHFRIGFFLNKDLTIHAIYLNNSHRICDNYLKHLFSKKTLIMLN